MNERPTLEQEIAAERAAWGTPPEPENDPETADRIRRRALAQEAERTGRIPEDINVLPMDAEEPETLPAEPELGAWETAFIRISPDTDPAYFHLKAELVIIQRYAEKAIIKTQEDAKLVTNDLALMAKLGKAIEALRKEYTVPVRRYLDAFNATFKTLSDPLKDAEFTTKNKVLSYNRERQEAYQKAEAARLKAEAEAEAERLKALRETGEVIEKKIETTARPVEPQKAIRAEMGTASQTDCWKWKVKDTSLIPLSYFTLDEARITKLVKAGQREIPGIEIYNEPIITTRG